MNNDRSDDAAGVTSPNESEVAEVRKQGRIASTLRALRHRNYQLFFGGQLISLIGTWMQSVAQSWLVYRITGSPVTLGLVGFASQIPVFLLSPLGGVVADRFNRHRILLVTQSVSMILAFILALLTLTGVVEVWHLYVLAGLLGIVNAFDIPARQAFVVEMVGREDLVNAIALNSSMFNGARVIGPAVAGLLVAAIGEGWCFFTNAVSYIAVIAGLLMMKLSPRTITAPSGSTIERIVEGFRFVVRTHPIRDLIILVGVISLMGTPYAVLMPVFADKILGGGAQGLGILMGASGIGALFGALSLAARGGLKGLGRWIAVGGVGFGLSLILFSLSRSFWLSALFLLPAGYAMMVQMSSTNTLIQSMVPDALRGRVMSVYSMIFMGMSPIGSLVAGFLSGNLGAPLTVAIGGGASAAAAILFWFRLPALRPQARELILEQQMAATNLPEVPVQRK
jgi:MFS family permease